MAFETLKASIYAILSEVADTPDNLHTVQEKLREELSELRALGQPLPDDLVELEAYLEDVLQRPERQSSDRAADLLSRTVGRQSAPGVGRRYPRPHSERD